MNGAVGGGEVERLVAELAGHRRSGDVAATADTLARIGEILIRAGRLSEAERALSEALTARPDMPEATYLRGLVHRNRGRPSEAAPFFERALAFRPNWPKPSLELGRGRYAQLDYDGAASALWRSLALDPGDPIAQMMLGRALLNHERFADADQALAHAVSLRPDYVRQVAILRLGLRQQDFAAACASDRWI